MRTGRPVRRLAALTAVSFALAGLSMPVALAQTPPTTPEPTPVDPDQPPASEPPANPVPGPIVADAGTGVGMVRILPGTVPPDSIFENPPELPKQALLEFGMGIAVSRANSWAYLAQERSLAESSPLGYALGGSAPPLPGSLVQTSLPDHELPSTQTLTTPGPPADKLAEVGLVEGSAHSRWDPQLGPCVEPIADTKTSVGSISLINSLPAMPGGADRQLDIAGSPAELGGLLNGQEPTESGAGSLLNIPDTISARSTVRLVDVPGLGGKAVQSTSTMQIASLRLFSGTPQELLIDVVSAPTLTATSTGDPSTSTLDYTAPVLRVTQGGRELGVLDIANPTMDIPVGVPETPDQLPVVGQLDEGVLDLAVLRMSIGELQDKTEGAQVHGLARLFDLKVLPGDAIGIPTSLAEISFGEQIAKAWGPAGGVQCDQPVAAAPAPEPTHIQAVPALALTSGAYFAVPLFWTGTGLLLLGSILVAALPRRR